MSLIKFILAGSLALMATPAIANNDIPLACPTGAVTWHPDVTPSVLIYIGYNSWEFRYGVYGFRSMESGDDDVSIVITSGLANLDGVYANMKWADCDALRKQRNYRGSLEDFSNELDWFG